MNNQLLFLQPGGVRVPVKLELFKHGGGLYLAAVNHELGVHVPFVATAPVMAAELRAALALVEGANAINDQGHISRAGNGNAPRVAPGAPNWDWLTPQMVIEYFQKSPVLHYITDDVKAALGPLIGMATAETITPSQIDLDLETVRPHLDRIITNGKVNKSEIARVLGIKPSGPVSWARLTEIAEIISSSSSFDGRRSDEIDPIKKSVAA